MARLLVGACCIALFCLPCAAFAAPSLLGPTGLITVPTAEVVGTAQWNVGLSGVSVDQGPDESIFFANVGLLPHLELGAARDKPSGGEGETIINAKLQVLPRLPGEISAAVGVIDLTDQIDRSAYAVLSHTLGGGVFRRRGTIAPLEIHVGVGGGHFDGLIAGLSAGMGNQATLLAEYDGDHVNLGARWRLAAGVDATIAALDGLDDIAGEVSFSSPW